MVVVVVVLWGVKGFCWWGKRATWQGKLSATVPAEFEEPVPSKLQLASFWCSTGREEGEEK